MLRVFQMDFGRLFRSASSAERILQTQHSMLVLSLDRWYYRNQSSFLMAYILPGSCPPTTSLNAFIFKVPLSTKLQTTTKVTSFVG